MRIFWLFSICYILLSLESYEKEKSFASFYKRQEQAQIISNLGIKSKEFYLDKNNWGLANALIVGDTRGINKTEKNNFKEMNLNHLFSPSGLHFSSLLLPFRPIFQIFPSSKLITFILMIPIFFMPGLFSLKRSLGYLQFSQLNKFSFRLSSEQVFTWVFIFDFMIGTFETSRLSFIYSLLFWGIFVFENKLIKRIVFLSLAQLMCSCFSLSIFYPMAIPFNFIISLLFTLFFPLILINFLLPSHNILFCWGENSLGLLRETVNVSHTFLIHTPHLAASHTLLWAILLLIFFKRRRMTVLIIASLLISMPTNTKDDLRCKNEMKLLKAVYWKHE